MMKKINFVLGIIAIFSFLFAFSIFSKEGIAIKVNSQNRELIEKAFNGQVMNTNNIGMIILGNGWRSGELTIYHFLGRKETLYILEGTDVGNIETYIRENGFSLDYIALICLGISIIIIIDLIIYKRTTRNIF